MADGINVGGLYSEFVLDSAEAERRLAEVERRMKALHQDFQVGAIGADRFEGELEDLARDAAALRETIDRAGQGVQSFGRSANEAAVGAGRVAAGVQTAGRSASSSAQFFLFLGQTVDDAQYGFRSIVNNIPNLAVTAGAAFGASTDAALKFGGAMALAGVAVNTNLQRLDEWQQLVEGVEVPDAIEDAWHGISGAVQTALVAVTNFDRAQAIAAGGIQANLGQIVAQGQAARAQVQADIEAAAAAAKAVEAVGPSGSAERGRAAREAIAMAGGGAALRDRLFRQRTAGMTDVQLDQPVAQPGGGFRSLRDLQRAAVDRMIAGALAGDAGAIAGLEAQAGGTFGMNYRAGLPGAREAAQESERRNRELARENDRREEGRRREREREVADVSRGVRDFAFGDLARRGAFGPDRPAEDLDHELREEIKQRMIAAGATLEEAVGLLPDVFERVTRDFEAEVRNRVLREGGTEADARAAIRAEQDAAARKSALEAATAADPSLRARAERFATMRMLLPGGLNAGRFEREIAETLKRRGLSEDQAAMAAGQVAGEAGLAGGTAAGDFRRQAFEAMVAGRRAPETFDASQLLERVQAGVGRQDEQKKSNDLLGKIDAHLRKLVEREERDITRLS